MDELNQYLHFAPPFAGKNFPVGVFVFDFQFYSHIIKNLNRSAFLLNTFINVNMQQDDLLPCIEGDIVTFAFHTEANTPV